MSPHTSPPFRADHVGSLLRPPGLLRACRDRAEGLIGPDDLRRVEDRAIADVDLVWDCGNRVSIQVELPRGCQGRSGHTR